MLHRTAPELPEELEVFGKTLVYGVHEVQSTLRSARDFDSFESKTDPETHFRLNDGLEALQRFQGMLTVRRVLDPPSVILHRRVHPRSRLVENALHTIGLSPDLDQSQQVQLAESWAYAVSSGRGRTIKLHSFARALAPAVLMEASLDLDVDPISRKRLTSLADRLDAVVSQHLPKRFGGSQLKGFNQ